MTTAATSSGPILQSLFAPAARIEVLGDSPSGSPEIGQALDWSLAGDIQRVEVVHANSGVSTYSLTLNNWDSAETFSNSGGSGKGTSTRFKYNNMVDLPFGKRLRIWMRYWPDAATAASRASGLTETWTPLISGPVTDLQYTFGERNELVVKGEDDMCRLKNKRESRLEFQRGSSDMDIVRRVLSEAGLPLALAGPRVPLPSVATQTSSSSVESLQDGQTYLEYLNKIAEKLDCEVYVEFDRLQASPDSPPSLQFHFEPARSKARYDHESGATFLLRRGETVISFTPTLKVDSQPTSVIARGRHRDRARPERVSEQNESISTLLQDELQYDPALDRPLIAGPVIRSELSLGNNPLTLANLPNTDSARAKEIANAELRRKAREFLTVALDCVGIPGVRAGNYVEVRGFDEPFDGFYYVTEARHSLDASGLRTKIKARRPGMPRMGGTA